VGFDIPMSVTVTLKNFLNRVNSGLIIGIIFVLVDEFLAEGYLFKVDDIVGGGFTHEKIVVGLLVALCGVTVYRVKKKR
jgi:hypothetical protein